MVQMDYYSGWLTKSNIRHYALHEMETCDKYFYHMFPSNAMHKMSDFVNRCKLLIRKIGNRQRLAQSCRILTRHHCNFIVSTYKHAYVYSVYTHTAT